MDKFIIFDVLKDGNFLDYEEYKILLDKHNLEYIEPITINESLEDACKISKSKYLLADAKEEGIICKKKGRFPITVQRSAKLINEEAKFSQKKIENIFNYLVSAYCSNAYINKELAKLFPNQSKNFKNDILNFGRENVVKAIMKDFTEQELPELKQTVKEVYIEKLIVYMLKRLENFM